MEISGYWEQDAKVITLTGSCEPSDWVVLEAAFVGAQIAQRKHIVLNLGAVTFSDHWILAKLFLKYVQLRRLGVRLSLVNPPKLIREKFVRTSIPSLVDYYATDQDAILAA